MDAQTVIAAIVGAVTVGGAIVGIALHAGKSRHVADSALHRTRNIEAAQTAHVAHVERTFVRKDTIGPQLDAINRSLERIETRQTALVDRFLGPGA